LFAHDSEPAVEMHPQELNRRRCNTGDLVRVKSRRGELVLPLRANAGVPPAQAFIAMHWGAEFMAGLGANALTSSVFCPQSKQPELKHCAVRVERAALPWQIVAAVWLPQANALLVREKLRGVFAHFAYAVCVPFGREEDGQNGRVGVLFRAAAAQPLIDQLPAIEAAMQLSGQTALRYADARTGQHRAMRLADDGSLQAFMLAGDSSAQAWVLDLLQQAQPAAAFGRALLAASKAPPSPVAPKSKQICACHDVSEAAIASVLQNGDGDAAQLLAQVQARLKCGTECGSCLPAVKTLVQRQREAVATP
jgi:assimilatory nitrate reductase catalytic subunit